MSTPTPMLIEQVESLHNNVSWANIEQACEFLAKKLKNLPLKTIIGVSRGGAIPAVMLSHTLKVPNIFYVQAKTYTEENKASFVGTSLVIDKYMLEDIDFYNSPHTLIVDDIYDTGATYNALYKFFPYALYSVIATKDVEACKRHDIFYAGIFANTWVNFPWEKSHV